MQVIRHLDDLPPVIDCRGRDCDGGGGSVVTIGNFDGFHVGHQAILEALREKGRALRLPVAAITFEPHPLKLIAPERAPRPVSTVDQRLAWLAEAGADLVLVQNFDAPFSRLSPSEFISTYLDGAFRARLLSIGGNFRFGHRHAGSLDSLRRWNGAFEVLEVPPVFLGGAPVSSSRIRRCLSDGEVGRARKLLGRPYEITGRQVPGEGRGRRETVPTLNLAPDDLLLPRYGVYLTRIRSGEGGWLEGVTNVGTRPTFGGESPSIETFVPDRTLPAISGPLTLRFLHRLRDERRFPDAAALREQILRDVAAARRFFGRLERFAPCDSVGTPNG
jgi:riboflavin kinase/FMN adenylyltransferase